MSVLDSIKNSPKYLKLVQQQQKLKKELENITVFNEQDGIQVIVRGDKKIEKIVIDGIENKNIKDVINDTLKKLDKKLEKDMSSRTGELLDMLK